GVRTEVRKGIADERRLSHHADFVELRRDEVIKVVIAKASLAILLHGAAGKQRLGCEAWSRAIRVAGADEPNATRAQGSSQALHHAGRIRGSMQLFDDSYVKGAVAGSNSSGSERGVGYSWCRRSSVGFSHAGWLFVVHVSQTRSALNEGIG